MCWLLVRSAPLSGSALTRGSMNRNTWGKHTLGFTLRNSFCKLQQIWCKEEKKKKKIKSKTYCRFLLCLDPGTYWLTFTGSLFWISRLQHLKFCLLLITTQQNNKRCETLICRNPCYSWGCRSGANRNWSWVEPFSLKIKVQAVTQQYLIHPTVGCWVEASSPENRWVMSSPELCTGVCVRVITTSIQTEPCCEL